MKHTINLFITNKRLDTLMSRLELCPDSKKFVGEVCITTKSEVNAEYLYNLIDKTRDSEFEFEIVAIKYMDNFIVRDDIKCLSDGKTEMWIGEKE